MSAIDVDKHLTMPSLTVMLALDRTTMVCGPIVYVSTQTPTRTSGFLLQGHRFVHQAVTKVPCEPSYTLGLSHLLQRA
jgi:hypothetical protein